MPSTAAGLPGKSSPFVLKDVESATARSKRYIVRLLARHVAEGGGRPARKGMLHLMSVGGMITLLRALSASTACIAATLCVPHSCVFALIASTLCHHSLICEPAHVRDV